MAVGKSKTAAAADPFATDEDVAHGGGGDVKLSLMAGGLVILKATGDRRTIETKFGAKDAVPAEVLDVENEFGDLELEEGFNEVLVFNSYIVGDLGATKRPLAGRLKLVPSDKGNDALVLDRDLSPADHKACIAAWQEHGPPF